MINLISVGGLTSLLKESLKGPSLNLFTPHKYSALVPTLISMKNHRSSGLRDLSGSHAFHDIDDRPTPSIIFMC